MLPFPHTPTFHEWVALIHDDPARARQHMLSLQAEIENQGLMADPALSLSIEEYDLVQGLYETPPKTAEDIERIDSLRRIGLVVLGPSPDVEDWQTLIDDDPKFARRVYVALQTKHALMGLQTPQTVLKSIEVYEAITASGHK